MILFARHGQTYANLEGLIQGQLDSPLTEEDIPQSKSEIASNTLKYAPNSEENFFIVPKIIE